MLPKMLQDGPLRDPSDLQVLHQVLQIIWVRVTMLSSAWLQNNPDEIVLINASYRRLHVYIVPSYTIVHPRRHTPAID